MVRCSYCKVIAKVFRATEARDSLGYPKVWCGKCPEGRKDLPKPKRKAS